MRKFKFKFYRWAFLLFKSLRNRSISFFVLVQIGNISSIYLKNVNDFLFRSGYMFFLSKWSKSIFVQNGAKIVEIAQPLICGKFFELKIKSYKVRVRAKKVVVTFVNSSLWIPLLIVINFVKFSWDTFTAFILSEFGMLV